MAQPTTTCQCHAFQTSGACLHVADVRPTFRTPAVTETVTSDSEVTDTSSPFPDDDHCPYCGTHIAEQRISALIEDARAYAAEIEAGKRERTRASDEARRQRRAQTA